MTKEEYIIIIEVNVAYYFKGSCSLCPEYADPPLTPILVAGVSNN